MMISEYFYLNEVKKIHKLGLSQYFQKKKKDFFYSIELISTEFKN